MYPVNISTYRRRLPHWRHEHGTYFVTWRLHRCQGNLQAAERDIVAAALRHFHDKRYRLFAFVVMDDHIHVLVASLPAWRLEYVIHSWKSYTAHQIARARRVQGPVWQDEYFDRLVRDPEELDEKMRYILDNPRKRWPDQIRYPWMWACFDSSA